MTGLVACGMSKKELAYASLQDIMELSRPSLSRQMVDILQVQGKTPKSTCGTLALPASSKVWLDIQAESTRFLSEPNRQYSSVDQRIAQSECGTCRLQELEL